MVQCSSLGLRVSRAGSSVSSACAVSNWHDIAANIGTRNTRRTRTECSPVPEGNVSSNESSVRKTPIDIKNQPTRDFAYNRLGFSDSWFLDQIRGLCKLCLCKLCVFPAEWIPVNFRTSLYAALVVHLVVGSLISWCQTDQGNADFVAYATVAHRVIESPVASVTGSWSPLFSWLMVPMIQCGIGDLIAGRMILMVSGLLYLWAVHRLAVGFFPPDEPVNRSLIDALMVCATIQSVWFATYLLDPDLLAAAILFCYLSLIRDERTATDSGRACVAGMTAGLAYLAKAYMLPFCVAQFVVFAMINWSRGWRCGHAPQPTPRLGPLICLIAGLGIVAGPWMAVLTVKYDRLTFTNAGRANHANVGPDNFGNDPLWHPPLTPDYIMEPVLATDWSPLSSVRNLQHQVRLIAHNSRNCAGLIPAWLTLFGSTVVLSVCGRNTFRQFRPHAWWSVITAALYCSGYVLVNLETRYIVPVVAPLLCIGSGVLLRDLMRGAIRSTARMDAGDPALWIRLLFNARVAAILPALVVTAYGSIDIYSVACVAAQHPQSESMTRYRTIARELQRAGCAGFRSASNRYHDGLYLAYASGDVATYLGEPTAVTPQELATELTTSGVTVYLNWISPSTSDGGVSHPPRTIGSDPCWKLAQTIEDPSLGSAAVEVYIRSRDTAGSNRPLY